MTPQISEARRLFSYDGPHTGELFVNKFSGTEQIDELFKFELELISENAQIATEEMLGKNVTVGIRHRGGLTFRYFNGHLSHFSPVRGDGKLAIYSAELVPWVWFLTLSHGCQIYQEKTVPQVIDDTFSRYSFRDYDTSGIREEHKPWENCCQYQESAWDFVARLMEMEGIYYYFKHENGKHTLVLVDNMASLVPCPYQSTFRYEHQLGTGAYRTEDTVFSSDLRKVVKPNVYKNNDSNFRIYQNPLKDTRNVQRDTGVDRNIDRYYYPANVEWPGEPSDYAMLRIEEQEHDHTVASGSGNCRAMTPGYKFDLIDHDRPEQNINYLIVKVTHSGQEGTFIAGTASQEAIYTNSFTAHPSSITYRPFLDTDEPQIASLQTATVVGPPGEEIYTDKYGRVRVKFHWDLKEGDDNGASSCWIRVAQQWAGPNFGYIWIPRVGMEVVVQFINGDPDRPLITGCVYNNLNPVPYPLPANKEWSGIKTRSTKGGTQNTYNEIRLVDSIGNELFRMQAEKDLHIFVKHDRNELILKDRYLDVGGDKHEKIIGDKYITVQGNFQEEVKKDVKVKIGGDATLSIQGDQTEEVQGDKNITVHGDQTEEVDGDLNSTVKGDFAEDIQGDTSIHNEGGYDQKVDGDGKLTTDGDLHIKSNGKLVIEASDGFTMVCGGAFIDISDGQITIQGDKVLINCGGSASGADSADPDDPDDPDTPDDFTNPDGPEFTSPAGDFPLPDNTPDTEDGSGGGSSGSGSTGGSSGSGSSGGGSSGGAPGGIGSTEGALAGGSSTIGGSSGGGSSAGGSSGGAPGGIGSTEGALAGGSSTIGGSSGGGSSEGGSSGGAPGGIGSTEGALAGGSSTIGGSSGGGSSGGGPAVSGATGGGSGPSEGGSSGGGQSSNTGLTNNPWVVPGSLDSPPDEEDGP
jgi:type VI secretion system secreted protein VgrG